MKKVHIRCKGNTNVCRIVPCLFTWCVVLLQKANTNHILVRLNYYLRVSQWDLSIFRNKSAHDILVLIKLSSINAPTLLKSENLKTDPMTFDKVLPE